MSKKKTQLTVSPSIFDFYYLLSLIHPAHECILCIGYEYTSMDERESGTWLDRMGDRSRCVDFDEVEWNIVDDNK